ncbi:lytic transglycosylase domain-containing protein [Thermospira aquatica]|uniref:Lytic transglycosylase domain-containing protein n=1 Tax=Thermospira aquatica TaxID=2828656 RepID=A0AAX3BEV0_9SPIR|nr:lytic transglycosylase domain-containing protein [Thermospira aquatica]URA10785.1 lytic transglycosylase domain-containing protein [Thermospira aquatica]
MVYLKHLIRWEFLVLFFTVVLVFNFAYEPNQRALIESLFEQHYADLQEFYQVYQAVETKPKLTKNDLAYAHRVLSNLLETGFILKPEVYHTLGKLYERENKPVWALKSYQAMYALTTGESFLKRDALVGMSRIFAREKNLSKAREFLEEAWNLPTMYRQFDTAFALLDIYTRIGEKKKQKQVLLSLPAPSAVHGETYTSFVKRLWENLSPEEQLQILEKSFTPALYSLLLEQGKLYIARNHPPGDWVEKWGIFLASSDDEVIKQLEAFLKQKGYPKVVEELLAYRNMSQVSLPKGSSLAQAAYAYRGLRTLSRKANYNPTRAEKYYETFLTKGFHQEYISKNPELLIRNLLAYKQFDRIVYWIGQTYEKMGIVSNVGGISEGVAFWYGYSAWHIGDRDLAFREWGRTIGMSPSGYYGFWARSYIREIFSSEEVKKYLKDIEAMEENTKNPSEKLFYNKILYGLSDGMSQQTYKQKVSVLLGKLYPDFFNSSLVPLEKLPLEKYFRWLVYSRFGFADYARQLLYEAGIQNETVADLAILKVLVYYKNFQRSRELFSRVEQNPLIKNHLAFLPEEFLKVLYPLPYVQETKLALSLQTNNLVDPYLVHAVIKGESLFYTRARSRAGAIGLMQLMPSTARLIIPSVFDEHHVSIYDPANNILLGTRFLASSLQSYGLIGALAVYNGGNLALEKTKFRFQPDDDVVLAEIHPYTETRLYIRKVLGYYQMYLFTYENRLMPVSSFPRLLTKK